MVPSSLDVKGNKIHAHAIWGVLCEQVPCDLNMKTNHLSSNENACLNFSMHRLLLHAAMTVGLAWLR